MDARWGWALATLAVAVGWWQMGWMGVVLAITVTVFWLLLQFSRSLRVMRNAADAPKDSAKDGAKKEAPKKKKDSC